MMGEVGADHGAGSGTVDSSGGIVIVGLTRGVVDGIEETVVALEAIRRESPQVGRGLSGVDHGGERRRVGADHQLVAEPALQTESRDAEGLVLIRVVPVDDVVRAL